MSESTLPIGQINPFDPAVLADPWDYYRRVREAAPVWRHPQLGIFLISSHRAVLEVVKSWEVSSNRFGKGLGGARQTPAEGPRAARRAAPRSR